MTVSEHRIALLRKAAERYRRRSSINYALANTREVAEGVAVAALLDAIADEYQLARVDLPILAAADALARAVLRGSGQ